MVKFNSPTASKDIVFIFLDRIHTCQNSWTAELIKNLSDYVLSDIMIKGFNVIQGIDENELLREATKDYDYAVVLSSGTEFINGNNFFNLVTQYVRNTPDFFLMGHIADRDDAYYELHDQCYIINLKKYKKLNYPTVGNFEFYSEHTQVKPARSSDNMHHDYTPTWVSHGSTITKYKHKCHGWNILSTAFANQEQVKVFPEDLRKNKKFYYPNHEKAFLSEIEYLYGKHSISSKNLFYPYNTEPVVLKDFKGPVQQLIIQASGLQWYKYLLHYGYDQNTVVRFIDFNLFSLECINHIVTHWNGQDDYMKFVNTYTDSRKDFLRKGGNHWDYWITMTGGDQVIDRDKWLDIIDKVTFEFQHEDLVLNTRLDVSTWVDRVPGTIIHLSNIFNYEPVAPFVSLKHRIYSERLLLEKLNAHVPDATVILPIRVSDKIQRPTWHMNGDWDGLS